MKRGQKGGAEGAIPIILLLILAVFIAGKFGLVDLSGVPVVGQLISQKQTKILVIGHLSPQMNDLLAGEEFALKGVTFIEMDPEIIARVTTLSKYDIIILENQRTCSYAAREKIADRVKAGGKLIVIGDACTRVPEDSTVFGWKIGIHTLADVMPVEIGKLRKTFTQGRLEVYDFEHPIFSGTTTPGQSGYYDFSGEIVEVSPTGEVLAGIDTGEGKVWIGMVESRGLSLGKVLYFAFDPATATGSKTLLYQTILYLTGRKG
ncbi:hypothetical protein H0O03_00135 [Candidatus Micrarchaeota archaeon]|nr:hypothetical protein [Candidatus Micrarchaeota archaeon]